MKRRWIIFSFIACVVGATLAILMTMQTRKPPEAARNPRPVELSPMAPGIAYVPIEQMNVPEEIKRRLRGELEQLKATGSLSGGRVTHEFASSAELARSLRKDGLVKIKETLAIVPSDMASLLDSSFELQGAASQGAFAANRGWTGFFQLLKSEGAGQWIELADNQLEVQMGSGAAFSPEFLNARVLDLPATLESLRADDGAALFNVHWVAKERVFQLTTRNLSAQEALAVAAGVTSAYLNMANDGWRKPYPQRAPDATDPLRRPSPHPDVVPGAR